jgi:hypothetical protein
MTPSAKDASRLVRVFRLCFIAASLMFVFVAFKVPSKASAPPQPAFVVIISAVALTSLVLGFVLPGFLARAARGGQAGAPPSVSPIQRWFSGCVLSLAFFESCYLFALVLHFVGAPVLIVESLFAAGILATVLWSPGAPPADDAVLSVQTSPGA